MQLELTEKERVQLIKLLERAFYEDDPRTDLASVESLYAKITQRGRETEK